MYLPKSKYTGNQYSNGTLGQGGSPYFGNYFVTTDNQYFTGNYPGDGPNLPLYKIDFPNYNEADEEENEPLVDEYLVVNTNPNYKFPNQTLISPTQSFRKPTESDYKVGEYIRYFAKKTNENIYYETQTQFTSNSLYTGFEVPWLLTGDKETVYYTNKKMVLLKETQLQISGLGFFLKDNYIKFYK